MAVSFIATLLSFLLVFFVFVAVIAIAIFIGVFGAKLVAKSKEKKAMEASEEEVAE